LKHAFAAYVEVNHLKANAFDPILLSSLLSENVQISEDLYKNIYSSREKDHTNSFRKMVYENDAEMDSVLGKLEDNGFINDQKKQLAKLKKQTLQLKKTWGLIA
jgi:hypothetical protein